MKFSMIYLYYIYIYILCNSETIPDVKKNSYAKLEIGREDPGASIIFHLEYML